MALKQHPDIAWPLIFSALAHTQTELLAGRGAGQSPGMPFCPILSYSGLFWPLLAPSTLRACVCDLGIGSRCQGSRHSIPAQYCRQSAATLRSSTHPFYI